MKVFIQAMRPKTLPASFIPPLVTFIIYSSTSNKKPYLLLACCLLCAVSIQIATNLFNDVLDFKKGADKMRIGPQRVTSSGLVSPELVNRWAISVIFVAILAAIPLIFTGGIPILILGIISLYLSYGYTGGPLPLAYNGLGEIFVFLFFGLSSVCGSYYLFSGELNFSILILGCIFGCLTTTLICINNLRDRIEDAKVNKNTLATRMSEAQYKLFTLSTILSPYLLLFFFQKYSPVNLTFLALVPATKLILIVYKSKGTDLNKGLSLAGAHLVVFSILLICSTLI